MGCTYCENRKPGDLIKIDKTQDNRFLCTHCGDELKSQMGVPDTTNWDRYFFALCQTAATKSPCLSCQIGALLVRDHSIVATGYNGPPRGIPHCGHERLMKDDLLSEALNSFRMKNSKEVSPSYIASTCPRKILGHESGTHMELCPAQHAEQNAISNAARLGVSVLDSTLYMNSLIPCQKCFGVLINAGINKVVIEDMKVYDEHTQFLLNNSEIKIREFKL